MGCWWAALFDWKLFPFAFVVVVVDAVAYSLENKPFVCWFGEAEFIDEGERRSAKLDMGDADVDDEFGVVWPPIDGLFEFVLIRWAIVRPDEEADAEHEADAWCCSCCCCGWCVLLLLLLVVVEFELLLLLPMCDWDRMRWFVWKVDDVGEGVEEDGLLLLLAFLLVFLCLDDDFLVGVVTELVSLLLWIGLEFDRFSEP